MILTGIGDEGANTIDAPDERTQVWMHMCTLGPKEIKSPWSAPAVKRVP